MTDAQKQAIRDAIAARPELATAGAEIIANALNSAKGVGQKLAPTPVLLSKVEILGAMSDESIVRFKGFLASGSVQAEAFAYRWEAAQNLDMAHPVARGAIQALAAGGVMAQPEADYLLSLGMVPSRLCDDIAGRDLTAADITEATNG